MTLAPPTTAAPAAGAAAEPVVRVRGLVKEFRLGGLFSRNHLRAVAGVDLDLPRGSIVALVGESGSGKSTIARCLARLEQPTAGSVAFDGVDVLRTERRRASRAYRRRVQMVFQDPFGSLNPAHRVEHVLRRPLEIHGHTTSARETRARLVQLMDAVGLDPALLDRYPHELSGGQRQRVGVARALAAEPDVILADEPTSMLDVSVRVGLLNLLRRLRDERGIAMLYITHDLASARYVADTTNVMFAGELVEGGESLTLMDEADHPYTRLLLSAVPDPRRVTALDADQRRELREQVLHPTDCPHGDDSQNACSDKDPVHHWLSREPGREHWVRCHRYTPASPIATRVIAEAASAAGGDDSEPTPTATNAAPPRT
ncbi:ATP-binding cassette domain-containing protein [Terrabacter sp. MAHUQ-38]|uniref:ATP-binding cassette domain-containing protein n=1 Tax=unclassified Terrabacter TaxID=2630222 RepID=UPI00165D8030|nr:ATP-binding cassette domain-containing protein [Terrabacter sp. MAHUQ-38]MBC9824177.1 ABC transporter ATP-binding protein [Terrabacter sp. MAHUQ-38]